jgi:enamine deaminase RidA (YjgF/YER057c/UK114 family)
MGAIADHLATHGHPLPPLNTAAVPFKPIARCGDLVFVSGQISRTETDVIKGPIELLSIEQQKQAVRIALLRALAAVDSGLPAELSISQVLKLTGYVFTTRSALDPGVLNTASELLNEWYGTAGHHARTAIAVAGAPYGAAVIVDLVIAVSSSG